MLQAKVVLGLFVLAFAIAIAQVVTVAPQDHARGLTPLMNLETKVLIDLRGAMHVLRIVPSVNSSGSTAGLWYSMYAPNSSDAVPPTLIRSSSLAQIADMALDKFDRSYIAWTDSCVLLENIHSEAQIGVRSN
jgi:hypothetical protein